MMAIVKLPRQRMYWSQHTRIPPIADTISVKRFEKIKKYIHFCDNNKALPKTHPEFDKLFKISNITLYKFFMGGNVVQRLTRTLEKDKNYKVFFNKPDTKTQRRTFLGYSNNLS